jgi:hypothetical protein
MCIQVFDKGVKIFQLGGAGSGSGGVVDITNYNFLWELDLDGEVFKGILLVTRWDGYYFEFNIFVNIEAHSPPLPFDLVSYISGWKPGMKKMFGSGICQISCIAIAVIFTPALVRQEIRCFNWSSLLIRL